MTYTIRFSDPTKLDDILVPAMPPGINTVDTSLSLVGRGYPNYGQKIAENFVHLLENFASPIPPQNPIEGQLWYDTSDPNNKVLRIMDGTATSARWPSANGIYQQGTDPRLSATQGLKVGDIWVDTSNNQLKIFNSNQWTTVGPTSGGIQKTGFEAVDILDTANKPQSVVILWASGDEIAIVANKQFTPKAVIPGFTVIRPGINLRNTKDEGEPAPVFSGVAVSAQNLVDEFNELYPTETFLRKNDQSQFGQIIDGIIKFRTPSTNTTLTGQGRDGIVINNVASLIDTNYIQFYKGDNDAVILNNTSNGKIILKTKGLALYEVAQFGNDQIFLGTSTSVSGDLSVSNTITVLSTASVSAMFNGGVSIFKNLEVTGSTSVSGELNVVGNLTVGGDVTPDTNSIQNLGSESKRFRQVYADIVGSTGSIFVGTFNGLSRGLQQSTEFRINGQITGTSVLYNGTSTSATFFTSLTPTAISSQTEITTSTSSLNLIVLNTVTTSLHQIARDNFLSEVFPTGMITAYGTNTNIPPGWLLCDGSLHTATQYVKLFTLIGNTYGGDTNNFRVPNMVGSTTATNDTTFVSYIIKT